MLNLGTIAGAPVQVNRGPLDGWRIVLSEEIKTGLGVALNESALLGAEVDPTARLAGITLEVLTLPETGPPPDDRRLQLRLAGVSRVAASLRNGTWNDPTAKVVPFELSGLLETVQSFGGCPIYGWEFFDLPESDFAKWSNRLSLDATLFDSPTSPHSITLFQEGGTERHLDLRIWFDSFEFREPSGVVVPVAEVIAGGERWWKAFRENDPRTQGYGMVPLS